jgi:transglutaminase-like putative cysteine protease
MTAPPFLIGAVLIFWGWQSHHLLAGAALALVLEAPRYLKLRLELGTAEHSNIADLSTIGFVTLAVLLAANGGISHGILEAFIWAPASLAPIMLAQMLSSGGRIPLSALFRYMRKLKLRHPETRDPLVDVSAVYVAMALIATGVANARGPAYYAGVVLAAAWALYAVRPRHSSFAAWTLMLALGAAAGYAGQLGIAQLQASIEDWVLDLSVRGLEADPYRSITEIGSIGRLKQYDAIVLRVYAAPADAARVRLLHRASYNTWSGNAWLARETQMEPFPSDADGTTWQLTAAHRPPHWRVRIAARIERGKALLPLPAGTTRIEDLTAVSVRKNALGSVYADVGADWVRYEAAGGAGIEDYGPPVAADYILPGEERPVFEKIAADLGLRDVPAEEAVRRIARHLGGFRYSLYRQHPVPRGQTALGDFMMRTHAGHCEYFASAAALLLRAAGVPSRYATGFAVMEHSALEGAYVVRSRHAHAWTRAWVGGRWIDLDTTPPDWFGEEAQQAPFWEGLADLARWAGFRWTMRGEFKAGDAWYGVLAVLAVILGWRMFGGKRAARPDPAAGARRPHPGEDSEFYAAEKALPPRDPGETQASWAARISSGLTLRQNEDLRDALRLHQRYRFDPAGLAAPERNRLRKLCRALAQEQDAQR